jgi:hypothetical protein
VRANPDGTNAQVTPFITGFMSPADQSFWGRPAYLLQLPDGSLLVSDEPARVPLDAAHAKRGAGIAQRAADADFVDLAHYLATLHAQVSK